MIESKSKNKNKIQKIPKHLIPVSDHQQEYQDRMLALSLATSDHTKQTRAARRQALVDHQAQQSQKAMVEHEKNKQI